MKRLFYCHPQNIFCFNQILHSDSEAKIHQYCGPDGPNASIFDELSMAKKQILIVPVTLKFSVDKFCIQKLSICITRALESISKKLFGNRLFSTMITLKAMAIGTLNIHRKIFKLKQIKFF